jgi:glutathione peroxidase
MIWNFIKVMSGKQVVKLKPTNARHSDKSFFELQAKTISGEKFDFAQLKGKKTMVVNTASNCGFTQQFTLLEDFYRIYGDKINILGFPCGDFFGQELAENSQIAQFCDREFKISFPLFEKMTLKKTHKNEVFEWLTNKDKNGWNSQKPDWNFCKYLIDEKGELVLFANSRITPTHPEIINRIEK